MSTKRTGRIRCLAAGVACVCGAGAATPQEVRPGGDAAAEAFVAVDAPSQPQLRREGDFVVERAARIVSLRDGGLAAVFEPPLPAPAGPAQAGVDDEGFLGEPPPPEPVPTLPPMVLQPSRMLDALREVRAGADGENADRYALSGRVQRYRGRNHLLLTGFEGLRPDDREDPSSEEGASAPPTVEDGATVAVEELMASMDADGVAGVRPAQRPPAAAPAPTVDGAGWRDGTLVNRRLGRVLPGVGDGPFPQSVFEFEAGDPPLRLLPCATTQRAEELADADDGEKLFELSGQVHVSGADAWVLPAALRWRPAAGRVDEPAH